MAEDLKKNQPAYENRAYCEMRRAWKIVRDVCEGTLHLRDLKSEYLPMEEAEDSKDYSIRLSRAIFFNAFERTLHGLVGMVFQKEPKLAKDVPEIIRGREGASEQEELGLLRQIAQIALNFEWNPGQAQQNDAGLWTRIVAFFARLVALVGQYREWLNNPSSQTAKAEGWAENVDLAGTHWTVFAKETFTDAMRDGHSFIYVDAPLLPQRSDGLPPDLQDLRDAQWRPYWISYGADQAVNWITATVNGQTRLLQITFREQSCEPDGEYGEKEVVRYRVLRPGEWYLYEETRDQDGQISYVLAGQGATSLSEIPVAVIYARKIGHLRSKPPLLDLGLMNICHWQKYSDLSTYLHIASRPILWFRGRNTAETLKPIGAYVFFDVTGDNGMVAFAETTGAALGAARDDLADLEQRMSVLGLSLLSRKNPTPTTATQELLDHVKEESDLATAARSLKDALELALKFTIQYQDPKAGSGGSVELGATIAELSLTPQELQVYSNLVASKQLSLETLWATLVRAGKLPEDFNPEKEKTRIKEQAKAMDDSFLRDFERGGSEGD